MSGKRDRMLENMRNLLKKALTFNYKSRGQNCPLFFEINLTIYCQRNIIILSRQYIVKERK